MRPRRPSRLALVSTAAVAVFASTGAGGFGPAFRAVAIHSRQALVQTGIVHESALPALMPALIGFLIIVGTLGLALGDEFWLTFDHDRSHGTSMTENRRRWRVPMAVLLVGGLTCGVGVIRGSVPERSHWVGTGLVGCVGVFFAVIAVLVRYRRAEAAGAGLLALTAFAGAGWWFSVPPSAETVAADRIELRGADVTWERVGAEKHATRVTFLDGQDPLLKRGDTETFLADLGRLPHLREVQCEFGVQMPGAVFDRIESEFPSVKVSGTWEWNRRKWNGRFGRP